uniref:Cadherin domain-containing protein n=1 Tax=Astyanax mexicanus TaxID=7994 RepID=A0A8B9GQ05_ASTMX
MEAREDVLQIRCQSLRYSIPEEMNKGSVVGNIVQDLGLDVKKLKSGRARIFTEDSREYIGLNVEKGTLVVKEKVDREELCAQITPCSLHFQIILENPMELHRIDVEILDVNDHAPIFDRKEIILEIRESVVAGSRFSLDSAHDPDVGKNSLQRYTLSPTDHFTLNELSNSDGTKYVQMILQTPLDREQQEKHTLILTAFDEGNPQKSGTIKITVVVIDANDNAPVFSQPVYRVSLPENAQMGSTAVTVSATDKDKGPNGEVIYSFPQNNRKIMELFTIEPSTGDIRVNGLLDYEKSKQYELHIEATDTGGLTDNSKVLVEITDVNDNAPVISVISFSNPIPEDSAPETVIAMLNIKDIDSGKNGQIRCSVDSDLPFRIKFSSSNFYSLVTDQFLDREKCSEYNITITAVCGQSGSCALPLEVIADSPWQLHRVVVEIQDINDNAPSFATEEVVLKVAEHAVTGTRFPLESAQDPDVGSNAVRSYTLSNNEYFSVATKTLKNNRKLPELVLSKPLDREKQSTHELILTAVDGGSPVKSGTAKITVQVLDNNDNAPQFAKQTYEAFISETSPPGTLIVELKAVDLDEGSNGHIRYLFGERTDDDVLNTFNLDSETGLLTLTGSLDYEEVSSYEIDVVAKDGGSPEMEGHCSVQINLIDANDNTPEIIIKSLADRVPEDSPIGTVVGLINARDLDSNENGKVSLHVLGNAPFKLKPSFENHYELATTAQLDREKNMLYSVDISATDSGSPPLSAQKTVIVNVQDVNDSPPVFSQPSYTVYVKENFPAGRIICSVSASDADLGENAKISYSILNSKVQDVSVSSYVYINSDNGSIYSMYSFDYEQLKVFQIQVQAKDHGSPPLSSNATVHVFILDQNDNTPAVIYPSTGSNHKMPRSAKAGHLLTKVTAVDADSGHNAWISYKLLEATDASLFSVNTYTGEVRTKRLVSEHDDSSQRLFIEIKDNGDPVQSSTITVNILLEDALHEPVLDLQHTAPEPISKSDRITFYLIMSLASVSLLSMVTFIVLVVKCARNSRSSSICYGPIKYVEVLGGDMLSQSHSFRSCLSPLSEFSDFTLIKPSSTIDFKDMISVLDASLPDSTWTFESQQVR